MPSLNQADFIEAAIDSVLTQDYPAIELIIADGGSSDATLDILKAKAGKFTNLRWTSESDTGPANAINRALRQVRGELVGWLNSDDLFTLGAIKRAVSAFSARPDWIMAYGQGEHIDETGKSIGQYPTKHPSVGLEGFRDGCFICQPTMFFKATLPVLIGYLDETQQTSFDFEYWMRCFSKFPERIGFIDRIQAKSRLHDQCITQNNRRLVAVEGVKLIHQYLGCGDIHWLVTYLEEVKPEFDAQGGVGDFACHANELLNELSPYLSTAQVEQARMALVD